MLFTGHYNIRIITQTEKKAEMKKEKDDDRYLVSIIILIIGFCPQITNMLYRANIKFRLNIDAVHKR